MRPLRRARLRYVYTLLPGDTITVPAHGKWLRRFGFRANLTIELAEIRRAARGAARDRDRVTLKVARG